MEERMCALQKKLTNDEDGAKVKFSVKVIRCLNFVKENPGSIQVIGAAWCTDGTSFISNSQILGDFLKIKPNTINTNFRCHGFTVQSVSVSDVSKEFAGLPDPRNWKKRSNLLHSFSITSSESDAKQIPCILPQNRQIIVAPVQLAPIASNISAEAQRAPTLKTSLPLCVLALVQGDSYAQMLTEVIFHKIKRTKAEVETIGLISTNEWIHLFGKTPWGSAQAVADQVCSQYNLNDVYEQLKANVCFLLNSSDESSCEDDRFCYAHFLKFFLQYGSISKAGLLISEMTSIPMEGLVNHTEYFSSQPGPRPLFEAWFQPTFNDKTANSLLAGQSDESWLVRPSSVPGVFVIHKKVKNGFSTRMFATHIKFNAIATNKNVLSIEFDGVGTVTSETWHGMLFDIMKLNIQHCPRFNHVFRSIAYTKADKIIGEEEEVSLLDIHDNDFLTAFDNSLY